MGYVVQILAWIIAFLWLTVCHLAVYWLAGAVAALCFVAFYFGATAVARVAHWIRGPSKGG